MPTLVDDPKSWSRFEPFEPARGVIVREPPGAGAGYWAGAPGATYDSDTGDFYLVYRLRRPRGVHPDRGAAVLIARGRDGVTFEDCWRGTKEKLESASIERCALVREAVDRWALFVSYVDPADGRWRIDRVEAERPDAFDLARARPALNAAQAGVEGVKDPFIFRVAGLQHMVVSYAVATEHAQTSSQALHGTADAYNTGLVRSLTGLATSDDGLRWRWEGGLLEPSAGGWDGYCTRIGCIWPEGPVWLALYDGSASVAENYEEQCGLAFSADLRQFHTISRQGPWLRPPQGRGALRYFDTLILGRHQFLYYEMARPDGSHDLRVHVRERQ